jgi:hypothetical protein
MSQYEDNHRKMCDYVMRMPEGKQFTRHDFCIDMSVSNETFYKAMREFREAGLILPEKGRTGPVGASKSRTRRRGRARITYGRVKLYTRTDHLQDVPVPGPVPKPELATYGQVFSEDFLEKLHDHIMNNYKDSLPAPKTLAAYTELELLEELKRRRVNAIAAKDHWLSNRRN